MSKHTPGPWPMEYTGDGKRIVIGSGLVEGPNGYEVAEVYSDDCPQGLAEANGRLIAAAPDLLEALLAVRETCLFSEDDGQVGVTLEPSFDDELFGKICAAITKAQS